MAGQRVERTRGGERYTEVYGFEDSYCIDRQGHVKSLTRYVPHVGGQQIVRGRPMTPYIGSTGYPVVYLSKNNKDYTKTVHRLVLLSWVGVPEEGQESRHLDGDRTNCCLTNLVWGSFKENSADKLEHGTMIRGQASHLSKVTEADVSRIRDRLEAGELQRLIAKDYGMAQQGISDIKHRRAWAWLDN